MRLQNTEVLLYGCAAAIAIGLLPMPYSYYMFIRVAAVAAFSVVAYIAVTTRSWSTLALSLCGALVMNPFLPLHLSKETWACIDGAVAAYIAVITRNIATRFPHYSKPELSVGAVAAAIGLSVLLGLFAGVGLAVIAAMVVIPLKWLGLYISGQFLNPLAYGAATAAVIAVLSGHAYYTGSSSRPQQAT
jgi:hypothetical protein